MTRREFENDVFYEAWRHGYNPDDAIQCADDCYYNGATPEQCVGEYIQEIEQKRAERQEYEKQEEQRYFEAEEKANADKFWSQNDGI